MSFSSLAISASARAGKQSEHNADIIEFVEAPWGLKMKLFPVQRVILKAHYGLELDDTNTFEISDWRRENRELHTEKSYLKKLFDEGRCNIGEVIPGKQRREMILSIGRRSGKCVTGDTLIPTDQGFVRIEDLDRNGAEYQPLSLKVAQEAGKKARTAYFYNGGVKRTHVVKTQSGFRLEGTDNHRIKVLTKDAEIEWKYMGDLKVGDIACINRSADLWAIEELNIESYKQGLVVDLPSTLNADLATFLGIAVGDGTWTSTTSMSITTGDREYETIVAGLCRKLFGKYSYTPDKRRNETGTVQAHSTDTRTLLARLGWELAEGGVKKIPHAIMKSPKHIMSAFLRGLFESDGTVWGNNSIAFATSHERLGREVQLVLLNYGIMSTLTFDGKGRGWRVRIKGNRSRRIFAHEIGFLSERKGSRLDKIVKDSYERGDLWDCVKIPYFKEVCELPASQRNALYNKRKYASYGVLRKIINPSNPEKFSGRVLQKARALVDADYYFDEIISIEDSEAQVYDLNVPDGASFVGNGFTNHNTTISACIAAYETYKLIKLGNPQKYYGLPASNNIQIISVATDKDQAGLLYQEVSGHYRNCSFFGPYTANNTLSYARFQTPEDVEKYGRYIEDPSAKATLKVTFRSCVAKGLRGAGNICVILDEVAHFTESGQSGAEEVYNAVVPSTSAYSPKDPNNPTVPIGEVQGRVILISSPLGKQGLFYNLFQIGMRGGKASDNILAVQAPTWEVNPTVPAEEFEKHYLKNAAVFFTEYGGEFTDRTRGWIEKSEDLFACVDEKLKAKAKGMARAPHFMGIDLGLVGDGTAVAIGHIEDDNIVVDLVTQIKAGEGDYADKERLDFDDVADWVHGLTKKFYIVEGIFDQWAGIPFEQALAKRGLGQMKSVQMTRQLTSTIYQNFKDMMWDERLCLYDRPNPELDGHEPYIEELLTLQANVQSKHVVLVEAPQVQGKHDDMSDALTRMVWLASQKMGSQKYMTGARGFGGGSMALSNGKGFAGSTRLRSGSDAKRISPPSSRGGYSLKNTIMGNNRKR